MIAKFRSNFKLANVIVRILFVLTFVFANWQSGLMASIFAQNTLGISFGAAGVWIGLFSEMLVGVIWMFILPFLVNLLLNIAKIYTVPRAEYCFLVQAFFALGYFILGCLNLVNLFTPVLLVWGSVLFPFISSLVAIILFYKVTAKLYFNDLTVVPYFRLVAISYLVLLFVLEVL